jgi:hypothetical protein
MRIIQVSRNKSKYCGNRNFLIPCAFSKKKRSMICRALAIVLVFFSHSAQGIVVMKPPKKTFLQHLHQGIMIHYNSWFPAHNPMREEDRGLGACSLDQLPGLPPMPNIDGTMYELLGVGSKKQKLIAKNSQKWQKELKRSYRKLALKWHPGWSYFKNTFV